MFDENLIFKILQNENNNVLINSNYKIYNNLKNIINNSIIYNENQLNFLSENKIKEIKHNYIINENFINNILLCDNIMNEMTDDEKDYLLNLKYQYSKFNENTKYIEIDNDYIQSQDNIYKEDFNNLIKGEILNESFGDMIVSAFSNISNLKRFVLKRYKEDERDAPPSDAIPITGMEKMKKVNAKIVINNNRIEIYKIDFASFFTRLDDMYKERGFNKIFNKEYTWLSNYKYKNKKIRKKDMKIKSIDFPIFFALEIYYLFNEMGSYYGIKYYNKIADLILESTWIKKLFEPIKEIPIDLSPLKNIKYTLKDYQREFVNNYKTLKERFSLNGYILSFDQGLGKTLTSIALAECLHKQQIVIVCPNSLRENWAYEIREYFDKYKNEKLWKNEVFVVNSNKYSFNKNKCKYIIVNQESIPKALPYLRTGLDSMIIVDESHNFRNATGKRTAELLKLRDRLNCKDNLLMSGTPIKALPSEIVPSLLMIDPMFDMEAAKMYSQAFSVNEDETKNIVNARFGIIMYRKTKQEVLVLPEKIRKNIMFTITRNPERYYVKEVHEECMDLFGQYYQELLSQNNNLRIMYASFITQYSSATKEETDYYLQYIYELNGDDEIYYHELDLEFFNSFPDKYVLPNITDADLRKRFLELKAKFITMKNSAMGKALGEILPKRRTEMFIQLYEENKDTIIEMIENNPRKTVIFSSLLGVINYIAADLTKEQIDNVKIIGGDNNRMNKILEFKQSDNVNVLLATSQTLSTGVTLTEANQMFFFGTPFRSADLQQCEDRIYRIGQKSDVYIYNVLMASSEKNLSTRMNDILEWSNRMFDSMMGDNKDIVQEQMIVEDIIEYTNLTENMKISNIDQYYIEL